MIALSRSFIFHAAGQSPSRTLAGILDGKYCSGMTGTA
jgi:hypothetical protein